MSDATSDAPAAAAADKAMYREFDAFLKEAIAQYYERSGKRNKATFIALLIASGEVGSVAMDSLSSGAGLRKLALGAAGVVALRIGLKYALGGPLGILLAGAAVASLVAYFVRNRGEIAGRISQTRKVVARLRDEYQAVQSDHRDRRIDDARRALMLDGLMSRFLEDLDRPLPRADA